jgi:phosphopantothenoylcysteine decarboxylase/phosphopantothenate--cysteine ligase
MLSGKHIVLGVTGGIAAYKAAECLRSLVKQRADVRVVMTPAATRFVGPLTFESLSGYPVLTDLFPKEGGLSTVHIDWARWADAIVVCPATANTVGKVAQGLADNALTTLLMATTAPVVLCPAMNKEMYRSAAFQNNQHILTERGVHIVEPEAGELACGEVGWGRLADVSDIVDTLDRLLSPQDFGGKRVLITAGPTREAIDPVRYLSNRSSGKMGYQLAARTFCRGATVTLVSGPTHLSPFRGVSLIPVETAEEMAEAVFKYLEQTDVLIMAAAVSDFRPARPYPHKWKKGKGLLKIELEHTLDILSQASRNKGNRIHVGFALETEQEEKNARAKLQDKNLDLVVINNPNVPGAGFQTDTNQVTLLDAFGNQEHIPLMPKAEVADRILDKIVHDIFNPER